MYDVVIIGAGIVGAMTARELTKYRLKVLVVEKANDVATGATKANSAIVHAGFDAKPGTLKARLNVRGSELMGKIAAELGVKYTKNGSLVVGFNEEDKRTIGMLCEQGLKNGVRDVKVIGQDELRALEPSISDNAVCALYAPSGAIVCPYELCIAAMGNAMDNGAGLKTDFCVKEIKRCDGGFEVCSDTEAVRARYVINAAGIYSDTVAAMVGDNSFCVHPRRGEYILLDKECGNSVKHTIFKTPSKMGKGILITQTVDGNLLLGPTSEDIQDKENKATTEEGLLSVIRTARENVKNIPLNKVITSFCGLRAVGDTGDFIINSPIKGFINVAGIESPGLSASPAIAEYVIAMLKGQGAELTANESFDPFRRSSHIFREATAEEKNRIIRTNPTYGRIVCRCEGVTEGEIVEAIHRNPCARDIDGVKRRTRAGMGRCQGGFCLPYVAEILARELNIPLEAVTKCGGSSKIAMSRTKEDK